MIAQLRSVINPVAENSSEASVKPEVKSPINKEFMKNIMVDPDNILSEINRNSFHAINKKFNSVFNPVIVTYNDKSGKIRSVLVCWELIYRHQEREKFLVIVQKIQHCCDKNSMNSLRLSRPQDVNVNVIHTSPSFLVKKPDGSHRLVTSFVELDKYVRTFPTKMTTTNDVITGMGKWKYIVKTDLKVHTSRFR